MNDPKCETCRRWNNSRYVNDDGSSKKEFSRTMVDYAFHRRGGDMGVCLAARNYFWGEKPCWDEPHSKMMPMDWAGFQGCLFTRKDHYCGEYAERNP